MHHSKCLQKRMRDESSTISRLGAYVYGVVMFYNYGHYVLHTVTPHGSKKCNLAYDRPKLPQIDTTITDLPYILQNTLFVLHNKFEVITITVSEVRKVGIEFD